MTDTIRAFEAGDLAYVMKRLRPADALELATVGLLDGDATERHLGGGYADILTWTHDGAVMGCLGVTPTADPLVGCVWSLFANEATPHWRFMARNTPRLLRHLSRNHGILMNVKDARNVDHIAWLQRIGFTFLERHENFVGTGKTFYTFMRIQE